MRCPLPPLNASIARLPVVAFKARLRETRDTHALGKGKHRRSMAAEPKIKRIGVHAVRSDELHRGAIEKGGKKVYNHTITHGNAAFKSTGVVEPMYHIRRRARHMTANMRRHVTTSDGKTPLLIPPLAVSRKSDMKRLPLYFTTRGPVEVDSVQGPVSVFSFQQSMAADMPDTPYAIMLELAYGPVHCDCHPTNAVISHHFLDGRLSTRYTSRQFSQNSKACPFFEYPLTSASQEPNSKS
ncbi:hypothetical protein LX32DRAFT_10540 [Colletotrichum zoysiae]|uniref:Uncharacterized protein n=1 Tax=Colletotrichum zoysiae TaxID=1216348 RepID=A0AAD9HDE0_9PEZI|nr:hypothetical protein LX32DRAFT_10540 [Colletotrichum zoysiae]